MKAILEDIQSEKGNLSFHAYRFQVPFFEFKWHYHPEFELTYIIRGSGYRIVGNSYEDFTDGDLVLLGNNVAHTWSSKSYDDMFSDAVVIQFSKEFILPFLGLKESILIKKMLESSTRGISFEANQNIFAKIIELTKVNGIERIVKLISILDLLSHEKTKFIAPNTFHNIVSKKSEMRINKVCLFIQNNFSDKISLKQIADLIYLTESNFCKFFKKATGKTYSDYLNEIRINEACRLLIQTEKTISQISYECGFENLSYFNRVFFNKKGMTPSMHRKKNNSIL